MEMEFYSLDELKKFINQNETISSVQTEEPFKITGVPYVEPHRNRKTWTQFEIDYIVDNYFKFTANQISKKLNRSKTATCQMISKLRKKGFNVKKRQMPGKIKELN